MLSRTIWLKWTPLWLILTRFSFRNAVVIFVSCCSAVLIEMLWQGQKKGRSIQSYDLEIPRRRPFPLHAKAPIDDDVHDPIDSRIVQQRSS